jgi:iron complex outermembrane recepter protein
VNYGLNYFSETRRFSALQEELEPDTVESQYFWYNERLTHDVQVRWSFSDAVTLYGGVINLGDQQPDFGETYYPVGAEGRTFYVGLNASLN